jgi:hypothetical protein
MPNCPSGSAGEVPAVKTHYKRNLFTFPQQFQRFGGQSFGITALIFIRSLYRTEVYVFVQVIAHCISCHVQL